MSLPKKYAPTPALAAGLIVTASLVLGLPSDLCAQGGGRCMGGGGGGTTAGGAMGGGMSSGRLAAGMPINISGCGSADGESSTTPDGVALAQRAALQQRMMIAYQQQQQAEQLAAAYRQQQRREARLANVRARRQVELAEREARREQRVEMYARYQASKAAQVAAAREMAGHRR